MSDIELSRMSVDEVIRWLGTPEPDETRKLRARADCRYCRGSGEVTENGAPHGEGWWPMTVPCDCAYIGPDAEGLTDDELDAAEVVPAEGYGGNE